MPKPIDVVSEEERLLLGETIHDFLQLVWSLPNCDTDPVILALKYRVDRLTDEVEDGARVEFAVDYIRSITERIKELWKLS